MLCHMSCGIWVDTYTVSSWPSPSSPGTAAIASASIGTTATRWFSSRARTTVRAPAKGSRSDGARKPAATFDPSASNCTDAEGAAASTRSTAASSGS